MLIINEHGSLCIRFPRLEGYGWSEKHDFLYIKLKEITANLMHSGFPSIKWGTPNVQGNRKTLHIRILNIQLFVNILIAF